MKNKKELLEEQSKIIQEMAGIDPSDSKQVNEHIKLCDEFFEIKTLLEE